MIVRYLKDHALYVLLTAMILFLFILVELLSDVPFEILEYPLLLSLFLMLTVFGYDFFRYNRKHRTITKQKESIETASGALSDKTISLLEEDYRELILEMDRARRTLITDQQIFHEDMADYYSMWVHQIKTPIAAGRLTLQILEKEYPEEKKLKNLSVELFRIEQYAEMVLTYLRTESMSEDLSFQRIDLDGCIRQAIRKYAPQFIMRQIRVQFQETKQQVLTDEKWLSFVLEQLISNAIKYTKDGGVITISLSREPGIQLMIEDTGIGIREEDLPRIFEKGFTGYNGRRDKKASGIGLYLVKKILDKMGHGIIITSDEGQGTKVILNLTREEENLTTL